MNALLGFKELATQKQWEILGTEHFPVTLGISNINATKELLSLREKGARVILLSCSAIYVPQVLEQAEQLHMITEWVWILTDEAISKVRSVFHSSHSSFIVEFLIQAPNFVAFCAFPYRSIPEIVLSSIFLFQLVDDSYSKWLTAAWLAQLVQCQSAVRKVEGSSLRPDQHSGS